MSRGSISGSPSKLSTSKRRHHPSNLQSRARACAEFATGRTEFRSIDDFIHQKRDVVDTGCWRPTKAQMVRDMRSIFGRDWPVKRGGGGRGRSGGRQNAERAPGLHIPANAVELLKPNRRPTMLAQVMETRIIRGMLDFERRFGIGIVTPVLITSLATEEILSNLPIPEDTADTRNLWTSPEVKHKLHLALSCLEAVNRPGWMRSFVRRHKAKIRRSVRVCALERYKAVKHQVELVMVHFRIVYQAEGFAQIQQSIARGEMLMDGYLRFENIIQLAPDERGCSDESKLEEFDGNIIVKKLQQPLKHIPAHRRFALDETPITPDAPILKAYTMTQGVPLSRGRSSTWTLLPVLCGDGSVLSCCLLQRCRTVPVDAVKFSSANDVCVAATENAQQTDEMWLNFAREWLPKCGTSFQDPGIVFVDGHSTHLTSRFIRLAAEYGLYVVVEPSHTSMVLQVADVGINRFIKSCYCREYTASMSASSVTGAIFDDTERLACVVRTIIELRNQKDLICNCFIKCGLLSGYNDVHSHFTIASFLAGASRRDDSLPIIDAVYIKDVLSLKNLAAKPGEGVLISEERISERQRALIEYYEAGKGFRKFFSLLDRQQSCRWMK